VKRMISLVLCLILALSSFSALALDTTAFDITVADKLIKQIRDGNGFSGSMQLEVRGADDTVITSIPFSWNFIHVNEEGLVEEEDRIGLALRNGDEEVASVLCVQLKDQKLRFQADVLGENWYEMQLSPMIVSGINADVGNTMGPVQAAGTTAAQGYGIPDSMLRILPELFRISGPVSDKVGDDLDRFITKLDIWLEGYRQSAVIGELEDGTGTIAVNYVISPAHVKAQVKQMLVDLLGDSDALARLSELLGEDVASIYLNPAWQPYYLAAVDALPLEGDLTIDRTVSFTGETLELSLSLPYRDPVMGDCTITFSRTMGEDEQPLNEICLESENRMITLEYVEYSSMTNVSVIQGVFSSVALDGAQNAQPPVAVAFVLRSEESETTGEEGHVIYTVNYQLSLSPDEESQLENALVFEPLDIDLKAEFASKPPSSAATKINATLTLSGEKTENKLALVFEGKTHVRWVPEELPGEIVDFDAMTAEDRSALGQSAIVNLLPLLTPYLEPLATDGAASVGIIGGSDGPTAIMVTDGEAAPAEEPVQQP